VGATSSRPGPDPIAGDDILLIACRGAQGEGDEADIGLVSTFMERATLLQQGRSSKRCRDGVVKLDVASGRAFSMAAHGKSERSPCHSPVLALFDMSPTTVVSSLDHATLVTAKPSHLLAPPVALEIA
jgi:hypothetical protein